MRTAILAGLAAGLLLTDPRPAPGGDDPPGPVELIVRNAKVVTLDAKSMVGEAVAVRKGRIVVVGSDAEVMKLKEPKTRVIDAGGKMVLPGLYDSHTHPVGAASSEAGEPLPLLRSIPEVLDFIKQKAATTPEGKWIVIRYAFP